jgi:hypothetical protein
MPLHLESTCWHRVLDCWEANVCGGLITLQVLPVKPTGFMVLVGLHRLGEEVYQDRVTACNEAVAFARRLLARCRADLEGLRVKGDDA